MENQNIPQQEEQAPVPAQAVAAPTAPKKSSGMGIASLVLGILAILVAFLPLINIVSVLLGIIGCILAVVSLSSIKKGKADGKGITTAGLVLCIVSLVISLVSLTMCGAILSGTSSSSSSSSGSDSTESTVDSDYAVTIDDTYTATNYNGEPVLVVTYTWANNSDDATSAYASIREKAFQNGVELESEFMVDGIDSDGWMKEAKPGASITYQKGFVLSDDSDVTLEVSELISLSDDLLASKTVSVA